MSLFRFLDEVVKPAQKVLQGAEQQFTKQVSKALERETQRAVDEAVKRSVRSVEGRVAGFLQPVPEGETKDEYYARTGRLRDDDWG